jgi:hypothetical protein
VLNGVSTYDVVVSTAPVLNIRKPCGEIMISFTPMWQRLTYKMRITEFYLKQASYIFIELFTSMYMSKIFYMHFLFQDYTSCTSNHPSFVLEMSTAFILPALIRLGVYNLCTVACFLRYTVLNILRQVMNNAALTHNYLDSFCSLSNTKPQAA